CRRLRRTLSISISSSAWSKSTRSVSGFFRWLGTMRSRRGRIWSRWPASSRTRRVRRLAFNRYAGGRMSPAAGGMRSMRWPRRLPARSIHQGPRCLPTVSIRLHARPNTFHASRARSTYGTWPPSGAHAASQRIMKEVSLMRLDLFLPAVLSVIAGSADVVSFLGLDGLFNAHITGNLVIIAAHFVAGQMANIMAQALTLSGGAKPSLLPVLARHFGPEIP